MWLWGGFVLAFTRIRGRLKGGDVIVCLEVLTETRSALLLSGHASGAGGMVEVGRYSGVVADDDRWTDLATSCHYGHPTLILSYDPDFPAVVGCMCPPSRSFLCWLTQFMYLRPGRRVGRYLRGPALLSNRHGQNAATICPGLRECWGLQGHLQRCGKRYRWECPWWFVFHPSPGCSEDSRTFLLC